jgi:hypothetical protein
MIVMNYIQFTVEYSQNYHKPKAITHYLGNLEVCNLSER